MGFTSVNFHYFVSIFFDSHGFSFFPNVFGVKLPSWNRTIEKCWQKVLEAITEICTTLLAIMFTVKRGCHSIINAGSGCLCYYKAAHWNRELRPQSYICLQKMELVRKLEWRFYIDSLRYKRHIFIVWKIGFA